MKSFFSSPVSKFNILIALCTLGVTTLNLPTMAVAKNACVRTANGDVACGELLSDQDSQSSKRLFVGTWEAQVPDNRWQIHITWNSKSNRYEGTLVKHGQRSLYAGFSLGELCWTATVFDKHTMNVQQKYRWGNNGVSTRFEWKNGVVDLDQSTENTFTMVVPSASADSNVTFSRIR